MNSEKDVQHGVDLATVHVLKTEEYQAIVCETPTRERRVWVAGIPAYRPYAYKWTYPHIPVREMDGATFIEADANPYAEIEIDDFTGTHRYLCEQYTVFANPEDFWKEVNRCHA